MKLFFLVAMTTTLVSSGAAQRTYTVGIDAPAAQMLSAVTDCARARALMVEPDGSQTGVRVDPASSITFGVDPSGNFMMRLDVARMRVPAAQREAKLDATKTVADELLACAREKASAPAPQAQDEPTGSAPTSRTEGVDVTMSVSATVGGPAAAAAPSAEEIDWTGSWSVAIEYEWRCSVMGTSPSVRTDSGRWTLRIGGSPNDLEAEVPVTPAGYYLSGSGGSQGLRLCGGFPLEGQGGRATTIDNNVCLILDGIHEPTRLSGRVEGEYRTMAARCRIVSGRAELTR